MIDNVVFAAPSPLNRDTTGVTVFQTEDTPEGYQRLVLRVLDPAQVVAWEKGDSVVGIRLPLMEGIATMEWRCFNSISGEWEPLWNEKLELVTLNPTGMMTGSGTLNLGGASPQDATGASLAAVGNARRPRSVLDSPFW